MMLPPYELKNKEFSKVMRGYNPAEVDEHFAFIIEKYTELYRENDELERKLKTAYAKLDEIKNEEESIRSAMVNAQRASSKIMTEANDRADIIINTARKSCDRILADFRKKIQEERAILNSLNQAISEFKDKLFKTYNLHISHIEGIELLDENEIVKYSLSDDSYTSAVVQNIKQEIVGMVNSASDDSSVVLQGTEGFVEVDVPQAESVVRTASVKDTIKELNKRFLSDEEDSVRPVLSTSDDDKEIAETLKKIGAGEVIDIEKSPDAVAGGSAKGMSDFEKAYQTPKDYGEIIKKRLKK